MNQSHFIINPRFVRHGHIAIAEGYYHYVGKDPSGRKFAEGTYFTTSQIVRIDNFVDLTGGVCGEIHTLNSIYKILVSDLDSNIWSNKK